MSDKLWTVDDLARHYRVTPRTINRWRRRGLIPDPVTPAGLHPRWNPAEFYIYRDQPGPKNNRDKSGHIETLSANRRVS